MKKVNYQITAIQPIHTGADEHFGTERTLRREKVLLKKPVKIESKFNSEEQRRKAILSIILNVWRNIDWDGISGSRAMGIYDEFSSKLLAATGVRTKYQFLNKICEKWGIRSLNDESIIETIDLFDDRELLETIRNEYQYLTLLVRKQKNQDKEKKTAQISLFETPKESEPKISFEKHFDEVPFISGNTIRGLLRRLVMKDFCQLSGVEKLYKSIYHQLFTGGNITDSTGFENIENREKFIEMCPMIGLLGSAIGNMTIQGELKVGGARLQCLENGTGDKSYWELIEVTFGTRLDSSKLEKDIEIVNPDGGVNQMKYEYEVFIKGSRFDSVFALTTENDLIQSAFYRAVKLLKDFGYVAGNSARDSGAFQMDIDIPENGDKMYLDYIKEKSEEIKKYFDARHLEVASA